MSSSDWRVNPLFGCLVGVALLMFGAPLLKDFSHCEGADRYSKQNETHRYQVTHKCTNLRPAPAIVQTPLPNPNPTRDEWRQEQDLSAQNASAFWAPWMFFATLAGVIYVARTLDVTRKASDAAAATVLAYAKAERAWIYQSGITSGLVGNATIEGQTFDWATIVQMTLENGGNTAAHDVLVWMNILAARDDGTRPHFKKSATPPGEPMFVAPHQKMDLPLRAVAPQPLLDVYEKRRDLFFWCYAEYRDVFDEKTLHFSEYIWRVYVNGYARQAIQHPDGSIHQTVTPIVGFENVRSRVGDVVSKREI